MNSVENLLAKAEEVEDKIGYQFKDKTLFVLAFTHRSFFNEHRELVENHNERIEFLGDSVLGLIVSSYLYSNLPSQSEGHLSHLRSHLVGAEMCIQYLKKWDVENELLLGKGESENMGRGRERILADLFEAIIGGIYLDGGLEKARSCFLYHFSEVLDEAMENPLRNWKADLQDYSQKKFQKPPEYLVLCEGGPPHQKTFVMGVFIEGEEVGQGEGKSKKEAEQTAAEDALRKIEKGEANGES